MHFHKPNTKLIARFAALLGLLLIGCTAIQSTRHTGYTPASGLAYYLPKGTLKLLIIQEVVSSMSDTAPAQTNAQVAGGKPVAGTPVVATPVVATPVVATPVVTPPSTTSTGSSSSVATPRIKPVSTKYFVSVDVELSPDRTARYLLKMLPSWNSDDYMQFQVTNGLLQAVTLTNSDQTVGVLSNLVLAAVDFYEFAATGGFAAAGAGGVLVTNRMTNIFLIDPFDAKARTDLVDNVKKRYGVTLDFSDFTGSPQNSVAMYKGEMTTPGIFYRPLERYQISWQSSAGSGAGSVYFPNAAPIFSMDIKRAAFVSQSYVLNLQQGIPVQVTLNKPSQALAISSFPLTVARALTALPTNLIQMKLNIANSQTALINAKDAQITNLMQLLQAQQALKTYQATNVVVTNGQTLGGNKL